MCGRVREARSVSCSSAVMMVMGVMLVTLVGDSRQQTTDAEERILKAKEALNFVENVTPENCGSGTSNTLVLNFDKSSFVPFTEPAIRTANMISLHLAMNNNTLQGVSEELLYSLVRTNVHGSFMVYGSGMAFTEDVLIPPRTRYCPYASRSSPGDRGVTAFDIALSYDYVNLSAIWWVGPSLQDYSGVDVAYDTINYSSPQGQVKRKVPVADYSDGYWTLPYFDCGGGNIWMVTYLAPVLVLNESDTPIFKGIASADIELTNIDINQCGDDDEDDDNEALDAKNAKLDVFRGTDNCQPTTRCVPIRYMGFKRSSYKCVCRDGFYFPDKENELQAYTGVQIDTFFDNFNQSSESFLRGDTVTRAFKCLPCARACVTCVDNSPCLYQENIGIRIFVVIVIIVCLLCCALLSFITFKYRKELVMKTASPAFLQTMILGAVLMCLSVLLMFPEPTDTLCYVFQWPFHLGFGLLYGSLLIKTWRISVIFTRRRKVLLTDRVLMQRLAVIPALMAVYLLTWVILDPPSVDTIVMPDTIKFFACSFTYWNYGVFGMELLMLLFGVYLSFTVRKAPAQFNESKYIAWAIYNAFILGVFIITITQMLADKVGPDVLFLLLMMQIQVFNTIALLLIFAPKIWTLHKGVPPDHGMAVMGAAGGVVRSGRMGTYSNAATTSDKGVQVSSQGLSDTSCTANQSVFVISGRTHRVAPLDPLPEMAPHKDGKTSTA